jgi:transposase
MRPSHTFPTKEDAMKQYVGLDVSQAPTAVCVIDETGQTNWKGTCRSTPEAIGRILRQRASQAVTVAMETGPLAVWHWHALRDAGFPVVCLPARHAHAALSLQLNKTDRNDAAGLAQLVRTGWYRAVEVKSLESHTLRLVLATRTQLVSTRTTLFNQIRGLLKTFGIVLGKGKGHIFERLVTAGVQGVDHVRLAIDSLLWQHVTQEIKRFDREITAVTRRIPACQHVMTVPGVGPVTTLVYAATVDNPARFKQSTDPGATSLAKSTARVWFRNAATGSPGVCCLKRQGRCCSGTSDPRRSGTGGCGSSDESAGRKPVSPWRANWRSSCIACGSATRHSGPRSRRRAWADIWLSFCGYG